MTTLQVQVPRKLQPLLIPARYKGAHGGRGGAKSHFFAEQLILRCFSKQTRAVCIREVQNSIKESVRQLLVDKIEKFGLGKSFQVLDTEIRGANGSLIIFRGMQAYNAENIKSLEGYDIAWVEEAQSLSDVSMRMLRPTIRKPGSELWFSWNPRHKTDAVDVLLRGAHPPKDSVVVEVNWRDNPWFPPALKDEMERDYLADPDLAEHVWGGGYQMVTEGAYYARLLMDAEREGRIGEFPYNPGLPLRTAWDLGVEDFTAIWFIQDDGIRPTVVDYYEVSGDGAEDAIAACLPEVFKPPAHVQRFFGWNRQAALNDLGRSVPFRYTQHYLPHDIRVREWGNGARTRIQVVQDCGLENVAKGVAANPEDRIQAVRRLLPLFRFNDTPRVQKGLDRLRMYRRRYNDLMQTYTTPLHDEASHAADGFGEYALNCPIRLPDDKPKEQPKQPVLIAKDNGLLVDNMSVKDMIDYARRQKAKRLYG